MTQITHDAQEDVLMRFVGEMRGQGCVMRVASLRNVKRRANLCKGPGGRQRSNWHHSRHATTRADRPSRRRAR